MSCHVILSRTANCTIICISTCSAPSLTRPQYALNHSSKMSGKYEARIMKNQASRMAPISGHKCRTLELENVCVTSCLVDGRLPSGFSLLTGLRSLTTRGIFPSKAYTPFLGTKTLENLHINMLRQDLGQFRDTCSLPWQSTKMTQLHLSGNRVFVSFCHLVPLQHH